MHSAPVFLPGGTPAPPLLTEEEVILVLRLRECGCTKPEYTLQRLRDSGRLKAIRVTRRSSYRLQDVLAYLEGL